MEEFPLDAGERVTRTVRKHWFVLLASLIPYLFLALVPVVLPALLMALLPENTEAGAFLSALNTMNPWFRLFLGLWWVFLWIGAFNTFTQYYLNHWVITTARIVRINQRGFFNRDVSSFLLNHVQDVSTTVDGILADLLGYGSVRVETAGDASRHFTMDGINDPQGMRDLIMSEIAQLHSKTGT